METTTTTSSTPETATVAPAEAIAVQAVQGSAEAIATATVAEMQSAEAAAEAEQAGASAEAAHDRISNHENQVTEWQSKMEQQISSLETVSMQLASQMTTIAGALDQVLNLMGQLTPPSSTAQENADDTPATASVENASPNDPATLATPTQEAEAVMEKAVRHPLNWI